jgi:cardiolipin synthase C
MSRVLGGLGVLVIVLLCGCGRSGPPVSTATINDRIDRAPQQVALLDLGFEALVQRIALIRSAKTRIDVQTFIYADDTAGRLLLAELAAAADRGVRVRLLVDAMFCALPPERLAWMRKQHPNLAIAFYNPKPKEVIEARQDLQDEVDQGLNHRMHNKLLVVDGQTGITGGRNHEDAYFDIGQGLNYRDREVMIRGITARQMSACASAWWFHPLSVPVDELIAVAAATPAAAGDELATRITAVRAAVDRRLAEGAEMTWRTAGAAAFWWDVPGRHPDADVASTVSGLRHVVAQAKERLEIVSPYCVLTSASLDNLEGLRARGLIVEVLTNSLASTDAWWAFGGYLRDRRRLVATGVTLNETRPQPKDLATMWSERPDVVELRSGGRAPFLSLHAKCMLLDRQLAIIGTFNLDPRSTHTNTEQVLMITDSEAVQDLAQLMQLDAAPQNAWRVGYRDLTLGWFHAPFVRLSEWTGDWLSLDIYPVQPTACFDLKPGATPVPVDDPRFRDVWNEVGPTPEADETTIRRATAVQTFGAAFTPLL